MKIQYLLLLVCFTTACSKTEPSPVIKPEPSPIITPLMPDGWTSLAELPLKGNSAGVMLTIGNRIFGGLGLIVGRTIAPNDFSKSQKWYEYDIAGNTWTEKADFPGLGRNNPLSFVLDGKIYVGMGSEVYGNYLNDIYEYEVESNKWTKKADFPGPVRNQSVSFAIHSKGYMGTGNLTPTSSLLLKDLWEYDARADTWTEKAEMHGPGRCLAFAFELNGKGYIGTGEDSKLEKLNDFQEYDPETDKWKVLNGFPLNLSRARGFSNAKSAIVAAGNLPNNSSFYDSYSNDMYRYNPSDDTWTLLSDLPAENQLNLGRSHAMAVLIDNTIYLGGGAYRPADLDEVVKLRKDFFSFEMK